jgi:integrase
MASIRKLPDGRWQAQFRPVPNGRQVTRTTRRKVDAQHWLDEQTASLMAGTYADPASGRITFAAFYADWAERQVWESTTRRAMDVAARTVTFADVPLRSIRRSHVEQWVKSMDGLAASTVHTRVNNVRAAFRGALGDQLIARDPSAGVVLPRRRRADAAMTIPTPAEVGALLHAADDFAAFVALCAFAGLRLGEAAGVQVGDVDHLRRRLTVARQVQREYGGVVQIRPPKYGSERVVHLPDGLVTILNDHIGRTGSFDPGRWLFGGKGDQPLHHSSVRRRWERTLKAAGLSGIKLHDLRHYFASGLIAEGCDVVTVQRALGHSSPSVTLDTYSHLWPSAEDRTRAAAGAMLSEALSGSDERLTNAVRQDVR